MRVREGDGLIAAVCVWLGDADDVDDEQEEGGAERGPTVSVRWTVPLRGDFEPGEKPPPVIPRRAPTERRKPPRAESGGKRGLASESSTRMDAGVHRSDRCQ